jgi:hypothetical protein
MNLPTDRNAETRWITWYCTLTVILFGGLGAAWAFDRPFYPITVWSLFSGTASLKQSTEYHVLVGEFVDGTERPVRALPLNNAMTSRMGTLLGYATANRSFTIDRMHPDNQRLIDSGGGEASQLIRGVRVSELLTILGRIHNRGLPQGSPHRLVGLRLEERQWPGGKYADYARPSYSWRVALE